MDKRHRMSMKEKALKIAVAMSGGLDSTMTALILKEQGHDVTGITADFSAGILRQIKSLCEQQGPEDSRAVAEKFGFPHHILRVEEDFYSAVIDPCCSEYMRGRTPNPCIICNPAIKFRSLLRHALTLGCQALATGHYAGIKKSEAGRWHITRGRDETKDQSYFLYRLSQDTLSHVVFPLGGYLKSEVRQMARDRGLTIADSPESQEICFIPDNDHAAFISRVTGEEPLAGDIVSSEGRVLGRHRGLWHYTIGQRRGMGLAAERPLYVIKINAADNTVVAGFREELNARGLLATGIHYMKETDLDGLSALVKTRSAQIPARARLHETHGGLEIIFDEPMQGISPGQAAVIYNESGDLLAGGTIERAL
jgi:tRNA-specific 2-thiouridylase